MVNTYVFDSIQEFDHAFAVLKVVFGEVIDGMDTVKKIEALGSQSGRTQKKITIVESGELGNDQPQK